MSAISSKWSRKAASLLGERRGRSVSRVIGTGISDMLGGLVSKKTATDIAHGAMALSAVVPAARVATLATLGVAYLAGVDTRPRGTLKRARRARRR
jgi:hypothetical protein